jgi:hypothetical protein
MESAFNNTFVPTQGYIKKDLCDQGVKEPDHE